MTAPARAVTSRTVEPSAPSLIDQIISRTIETADARKRITPVLRNGDTFDRIAAAVREEMIKTPKLAECAEESITAAVVKIQRWRLEIGETAYLVPFRDTRNDRWVCTPVRSYLGDIQLLMDNGVARRVDAKCVYKNETFIYEEGLNPRLEHHPMAPAERGELIGAYAIVWLTYTNAKAQFVFLEEIDEVRKKHSVQWKEGRCPPWWAMKRAIKVTTKLLPKNARLQAALAAMDEEEEGFESAVTSTRSALASLPPRPAHISPEGEDRNEPTPLPPSADNHGRGQDSSSAVMRFGRSKGKPLTTLDTKDIESARKWASDTDADKFAEAIEELDGELERRREMSELDQGTLSIATGAKHVTSRSNSQGEIPGLDGGERVTQNALAQP